MKAIQDTVNALGDTIIEAAKVVNDRATKAVEEEEEAGRGRYDKWGRPEFPFVIPYAILSTIVGTIFIGTYPLDS